VLFGDRSYSDGHTSAVRVLCPTITATLQRSIHCALLLWPHISTSHRAPLLWPHISSPFIVPQYYGHTSAVHSLCPHYYGHTSAVHSLCPTIMATLQQFIYCAPLLRPHFSSPFIVPHYYGQTSAPFIMPRYYGNTPAV